MDKLFRELRADEIDVRVNTINEKGATLLLYKDARADMILLDETFGPFNWTRSHEIIDGRLYCTVSVRDPKTGTWVSKQDVGTESDTEREKGQASDSFKRACVNWGIGRELYSSPFIWVSSDKYTTKLNKAGKPTTYDKFRVTRLAYEFGKIVELEIVNDSMKGNVVFRLSAAQKSAEKRQTPKYTIEDKKAPETASATEKSDVPPSVTNAIGPNEWTELKSACRAVGMSESELLARYQVTKPSEITLGLRDDMIAFLATV